MAVNISDAIDIALGRFRTPALVADRIIRELSDRPLSVIRVIRGQAPFMQKNVPVRSAGGLRVSWPSSVGRVMISPTGSSSM